MLKKIILLLIYVTLVACEGSTIYREKHGLINEYDIIYNIQSIRIDDDSEFHIVAVSNTGDIKTYNDMDVPYDINIQYGNYEKPILIIHISDRCCGEGNYTQEGIPNVFLPFNYKINTFDD